MHLMMTSGAAAALSAVLCQQWEQRRGWRAARVAHAAAVSLQRCGVGLLSTTGELQLPGCSSSFGTGGCAAAAAAASGGWLPCDAVGVPVGAAARGRFPDAAAFASTAAAQSKLLLPATGSAAAAAAGRIGQQQCSRVPLCGWDLIAAVGSAAHPVAACLMGRSRCTALRDLPSLVLEVNVSEAWLSVHPVIVWSGLVVNYLNCCALEEADMNQQSAWHVQGR
jgi:hypothetical protein